MTFIPSVKSHNNKNLKMFLLLTRRCKHNQLWNILNITKKEEEEEDKGKEKDEEEKEKKEKKEEKEEEKEVGEEEEEGAGSSP